MDYSEPTITGFSRKDSISVNTNEKYGVMYKKGGADMKQAWQKRYFAFDGVALKYFRSENSFESLRIIPVSTMKVVTPCKQEGSPRDSITDLFTIGGRKHQFELECFDRSYRFGTDTLDTSIEWQHHLTAAIIDYEKKYPNSVRRVGGVMNNPDISGRIRFDNNSSAYFVALKNDMFKYYRDEEDFNNGVPIHEIPISKYMMSVKDVDRVTLKVDVGNKQSFELHFENIQDAAAWKTAIDTAIGKSLGSMKYVDDVRELEANRTCADCSSKETLWASINLGIVLCPKCAGCHRSLGVSVSKIRSLFLDDIFATNVSVLQLLHKIGNEEANRFWYKNPPTDRAIDRDTPIVIRRRHIEEKYAQKKFVETADEMSIDVVNKNFVAAVKNGNILKVMRLFYRGANIYGFCTDTSETVMELAEKLGHHHIKEFLQQNEYTDISMRLSNEIDEMNKKAHAYCEGYLEKTGPKMKGFLKRRCVLNYGCLMYYNEQNKRSSERGCIRMSHSVCVSVPSCKKDFAFDISNLQEKRVYRFAANNEEDLYRWTNALCSEICPTDTRIPVKFDMCGICFAKSHISPWRKSWVVLKDKAIHITYVGDKTEKTIVLSSGTNVYQSNVKKHKVLPNEETSVADVLNGNCYVEIIAPDMSEVTSFQGLLLEDTNRLFEIVENYMK
ncbi:arf-GAP with Rho-GAP domain, ANK repeat and PH domain-containing protein 2-like isoform X2 [Dreissena polymorpha]|uniref:Uncharacterized protein n=1 Tax=Dreissena polymorpha TaxID=45954 RepID=A0A9D4K8W3_DREPO|nr:arf-GAP with Rho-GAP domain, ANK repeat and PH domain-containing protein 2-like isoform X2 [Dreissena polymorpha]XP_052281450.1 arf-GAP with Rho-GAP domain, ANK repeat and PH domain-containing protein 2-like isoform X2 [Dreissena polymorpha]KAH3835119.1 hypothetical protein DPMN_108463 [Dreissena polymorpha]